MAETVIATSRQQVHSALKTSNADRIVVQGDDELLKYAEAKISVGSLRTSPARMRLRPWMKWSLAAAALAAVLYVGWYGWRIYQMYRLLKSFDHIQLHALPQSSIIETAIWAGVVVIAIIALYLLIREAMRAGNNVEVSWEVTEKVKGKLVITKVTTPALDQKPQAAAGAAA